MKCYNKKCYSFDKNCPIAKDCVYRLKNLHVGIQTCNKCGKRHAVRDGMFGLVECPYCSITQVM